MASLLSRRTVLTGLAVTAATAVAGPALAHKDMIAYFTLGSYVLTEDALEVVRAAADYANALQTKHIPVTGHADDPGNDEDNLELSRQRALAVSARLVELGIDQGRLDITWKGSSQHAVVKSGPLSGPLNRRVIIEADYHPTTG